MILSPTSVLLIPIGDRIIYLLLVLVLVVLVLVLAKLSKLDPRMTSLTHCPALQCKLYTNLTLVNRTLSLFVKFNSSSTFFHTLFHICHNGNPVCYVYEPLMLFLCSHYHISETSFTMFNKSLF